MFDDLIHSERQWDDIQYRFKMNYLHLFYIKAFTKRKSLSNTNKPFVKKMALYLLGDFL